MLGLQRSTSQHEHQLLRVFFTTSAQAAEGNFRLILKSASTEAVVEKTNVARDKELVRLCTVADYSELLKIWQYLEARPAGNSSGMLCTPCGGLERPTHSKGRCILRGIKPESKVGPIKEMSIFDTEGCSGTDVKVPRMENPDMLVWVNAYTKRSSKLLTAAINTLTLKENRDNETSASSGQVVARDVTLGALEQEPQPFNLSVVPCSRDVPDDMDSGFSSKTASSDGASSWK